jgi:hypothetical protein
MPKNFETPCISLFHNLPLPCHQINIFPPCPLKSTSPARVVSTQKPSGRRQIWLHARLEETWECPLGPLESIFSARKWSLYPEIRFKRATNFGKIRARELISVPNHFSNDSLRCRRFISFNFCVIFQKCAPHPKQPPASESTNAMSPSRFYPPPLVGLRAWAFCTAKTRSRNSTHRLNVTRWTIGRRLLMRIQWRRSLRWAFLILIEKAGREGLMNFGSFGD